MMSVCKVCLHWRSDAVRLTSSASAQRILHHANFLLIFYKQRRGLKKTVWFKLKTPTQHTDR